MTVDSDTGALAEPVAQEKVRCYFDVTLGGLPAGRIVFELFPAVAPKTCENFRALCTGEAGIGQKTGKALYYKGIIFHRVVKDFMIQSGDFSNGNGTGGESIYGGTFDDEAFTLKHDRAFLLSMANRGKNTNGSQFFITTQPAPHLDNVHVVFGHVVSGQDLVRQLEQLPVDRNSRPLQDAMVSNCGELVRQMKVKKEKKNKKAAASSDDSEDETSRKRKKDKKKKRGKESSPRTKRAPEIDASIEEGELEDEIHPMATVTKIDPDEIPEVSNKYLMRNDATKRAIVPEDDRKRDNRGKEQRGFGWMKKNVPMSRSGRIIKGRGHFRYRTPSRSRSRSRSQTPVHWRAAQKRTIKMTDLEKLEDEKRERESEIKRRETERKKRHEELAKGVSKKSFFELNQEQSVAREKSTSESPDAAAVSSKRASDPPIKGQEEQLRGKSNGSIDMNALDYEHHPAGTSDTEPDEATHKKSDTLAKALGVEPKKKSNDSVKTDERRKPVEDRKRDRSRSRSRDRRRGGGDGYRGRSPPGHHRGGGGGGGGNRNRQPFGFSAAPHYNRYNQQQHGSNRRYGGGNNVGGSYYSRPRGRFGGNNERYDRDRDRSRRSRSHEGGFSRRSRRERSASHSRSRTPEHRRRRKDNSSTGSSQERDERSKRNRSVTPTDRRSASRPVMNEKTIREKTSNGKELDTFRDKSPGSVATAIVVAATAAVEAAKIPTVSIKSEELSEEEKARMQKEKMLKRAETLLLLKSHMEKEIEEQQRKAREKQQQQLLLRKQKEEQEARALDAVMDLAQLKQLKKETIQKLNAQEAAQRILHTVVTNVSVVAGGSSGTGQKKKSKSSNSKRRSSRSSSSSSSSSAASRKEKSRKKRKDKKRKARRHSSSSSS
ncbi:peptidyl-prolyl cis-trans isomerase G [Anopheles moucheti]|uniref:peptidyl-prolyl cis-trans isomerase G n=1 Tax=Anopheles moucheti TaxID=186751 RepID=UPI0022F09B55|nr:peptidyl-prolyl cis-trans isomerase G [Anopheles moucheti]